MTRSHVTSTTNDSAPDMDAWLRLERLDYVRLGERLAVVRLLAGLGAQLRAPTGASLVVQAGQETTTYLACGCKVERAKRPRLLGGELLWRACFAVPLDVVEFPCALFELSAPGRAALALPVPDLRLLTAQRTNGGRGNPLPAGSVRRRLVVVATTLAITGSTPGIALAATGAHHHGAGGSAASRGARVARSLQGLELLSTSGAAHLGSIEPPPTARWSGGAAEGSDSGERRRSGKARGSGKAHGSGKAPARKALGSGKTPGSHHRSSPGGHPGDHASPWRFGWPAPITPAGHLPAQAPATTGSGARKGHPLADHGKQTAGPSGGASVRPPEPTIAAAAPPAPTFAAVPTAGIGVPGLGPDRAAATAWSRLSELLANGNRPPAFLIPIYKAAGHRYHVPWPVLAAINSIETDYGRNVSTSSAGAIGWMQFMPATWTEYGVAAGRHSRPDPYDPRDAIFSAARYLAANGARHHLRKAIFAYNHATWYVDEVLWTAVSIANHTPKPGSRVRLRLDAMQAMAVALDGEPYIWGGGHAGWEIAPGYDCSGFVSAVLHAAGYLAAPATTQTLPSERHILTGPGRYVTIFDRTDGGGAEDDHVIIDLNGRWWESGGSDGAGGAPRVHRLRSISATYLLTFNEILHPRGL